MFFDNRLTEDDMQRVHDICPNPPPALLMATIQSAMRSQLTDAGQISTAQVVSSLNRQLFASTARICARLSRSRVSITSPGECE